MNQNTGWVCPRCNVVLSPTMKVCVICSENRLQKGEAETKDEAKQENTQKFLVENQ